MNTKLTDGFGNVVEGITPSPDFKNMTYDEHFKNVFSIKRILAVIIKETIDIYKECSVDEVVGLVDTVDVGMVNVSPGSGKIDLNESYVNNEASIKYDILVKIGIPSSLVEEFSYHYVQIKLDLEMQRKFNPGYILSNRGLYYSARMISDQLSNLADTTNYNKLMPVYSIWITLAGNSGMANKVLKYQLQNTSSGIVDRENSSVKRMDTVTKLLNIFFICIDEEVLSGKIVKDGLEDVVEFISLMFAGQFSDKRLIQKHDIKFNMVVNEHGREMANMAAYLSEMEEVREEARMEGEVIGEVRGEAKGIVSMGLKFGIPETNIIETLTVELDISINEAQEYLKGYKERQ